MRRGANITKGCVVSDGSRAEIIRAESVTKRFGALVAVDNVNYLLRENEVAGIIGSNGAGKTTFFNLLTGYYPPDQGTIRYKGEDITHMTPQQRVARGLMRTFQLTATFDNLSVIDNLVLAFFRAHRKSSMLQLLLNTCKGQRNDPKIVETLETFDLQDLRDRLVKNLSLGEKRRLEIAMAVLTEPKVLLLDEPLAGLAESEIQSVLNVLRQRVGRQTILIVEHKISHVQDFLQRLTVMHDGRIIADGGLRGDVCAIRKCAGATGRSTPPASRTGPSSHDEQRRYPDGRRAERRLRRIESAVRRQHERATEPGRRLRRPQRRRQEHAAQEHRRIPQADIGIDRLQRRPIWSAWPPSPSPEWESNTFPRTRRCFPT